jgi:hypothetical protein
MKNRERAVSDGGLKILWSVQQPSKPGKARKNWPRLRVINNALVVFAETGIDSNKNILPT